MQWIQIEKVVNNREEQAQPLQRRRVKNRKVLRHRRPRAEIKQTNKQEIKIRISFNTPNKPVARSSTQVKETAGNLANRSTEALSNLSSKARENASEVSSRFGQLLRDNPLAVGAVAVAAGTAVGLALPSTRLESEYIGETSEMLVDKVQEVARGAIDKVQDAAKQMTQPENKPQQGSQP